MNKKSIINFIIIVVILVIFAIVFKFFFSEKNVNNEVDIKSKIEIDYSEIGINPNDYETLEDFLADTKILSGLTLDISKNDFVICTINNKGNIIYTPFYHSFINKGLFDSKKYKNKAIIDIYTSYKNDCLIGGYLSNSKSKIIFEEDLSHNDTYIINNIFTRKTNINDIIKELEKTPNKPYNKKELLSYLYDLKGYYDKADQNRKKTCLENEFTCSKTNKFELYGKIIDENNKPLPGVKITFLNNPEDFVISNSNGEYSISLEYYPFAHLRFKANKKGYSDGFKAISFNNSNGNWERKENLNFYLNKAHYIKSKNKNEVIIKNGKKYFEFRTKQSYYLVPSQYLFYKNGDIWDGEELIVYMYEFKKSDNISNLMLVDTFDEIQGFAGNLMKTFGMPYIQFFDKKTNKELFVYKSNPMILQNNIYHMQELYDNYDGIYEAITKEDMQFLVDYSKEKGGYPIDFNFLIKNNFLRWPAWWALDRKKGIWESIPAKVINVDGLIETEFYSINDL